MANHFRALGFRVDSEEDLEDLYPTIVQDGQAYSTDLGEYLVWPSPTGPQIWLHMHRGAILGLQPHFSGRTTRPVRLLRRVQANDDSPLEGGFYGWAGPVDDSSEGDYPFAFYVPDFRQHDTLALPTVCDVQLTAFADSITAYPSEPDFHNSQAGNKLRYATESFLPIGSFEDPPRPTAHFVGRVTRVAAPVNPLSGLPFVSLEVLTLGGPIDVVSAPSTIDGNPTLDGVVEVTGWLSGRPQWLR